ncbi:type I-E CRISPR-associated protein Cas5/CasD [Rhodovulum sp. 12E13]|uniref:type I-E CRISPR-associated protein Cas5/CasD n=1 Tax=Rhodovulum sp. 12E13 TaxID=2203891 RepID=UPI000E12EA01|nr:type I-E CRISPR-associated protein Cas5/CasD [Rhodovulum sp. 12E13]RDC68024.1 type I-E CRISPR-associated protein Cas5/CasD [Rhodovulum sp. 12E13]
MKSPRSPRLLPVPEYLVFQLAATVGAMGELAGHAHRGTLDRPGRSAVVGLLGAALGRRREDDFSDLDQLMVFVATFDPGRPLRDYHTVQTVPTTAARAPQSRPEALRLAEGAVRTTLTRREYRSGCLFGVALAGPGLAELAGALRCPVFPLYLGRKACPLCAPLDPRLVEAPEPVAALTHLRLPPWARSHAIREVAAADGSGLDGIVRMETRQDRATDRRRWHFARSLTGIATPQARARGAEE